MPILTQHIPIKTYKERFIEAKMYFIDMLTIK